MLRGVEYGAVKMHQQERPRLVICRKCHDQTLENESDSSTKNSVLVVEEHLLNFNLFLRILFSCNLPCRQITTTPTTQTKLASGITQYFYKGPTTLRVSLIITDRWMRRSTLKTKSPGWHETWRHHASTHHFYSSQGAAKVVQAHNNDQVGDDQPRGLCHVEARDSETLTRTEPKSISNKSRYASRHHHCFCKEKRSVPPWPSTDHVKLQ